MSQTKILEFDIKLDSDFLNKHIKVENSDFCMWPREEINFVGANCRRVLSLSRPDGSEIVSIELCLNE